MTDPRPIVPSIVVQEEGSRKVLIYVNIPELRVKRSFPNLLKQIPVNGQERRLDFQNHSLNFTISVQTRQEGTKVYALVVRRLPGEIQPERCSIKYQRGGCWITLIKFEEMDWMNRICNDLNPGLDTEENEDNNVAPTTPSAPPVDDIKLRDTAMPQPFSLVPLAPSPSSQLYSPKKSSSSNLT